MAGAAHLDVDGLVTTGPVDFSLARRSNPLDVEQGAGLLGLFLRSRGVDQVVRWERDRQNCDIGTQRFIVTRCLLDAGWRWWSGCVAAATAGDPDTMRIAQGVHMRFERVLKARDEVMILCLGDTSGASVESDVLYHLDAMLLWVGGALDAVAQIADRSYGLRSHRRSIGWRSGGWRNTVATTAPELWEITETGTSVRAFIDLVAELRNTIHGAPATGVSFQGLGQPRIGLMQVPADTEAKMLAAVTLLGGRDAWGLVREGSGPQDALWDPYVVAQMVVPFAAAVLNLLMRATEVERLPGVVPQQLLVDRPIDGFFQPHLVARIAALNAVRI